MSVLVIAEHNNVDLRQETNKVVTAALQLGESVDLLVAGFNCSEVATQASKINGVNQVLLADAVCYENQLAESLSALILEIHHPYTHIVSSSSSHGKNFLPRVAAMLDVEQISDVIKVISPDTFIRPIYAGNATATIQCLSLKKVLSVRPTAFEAVVSNGSSPINKIAVETPFSSSALLSEELTKSERPELSAARVIISGGRGMQDGKNFTLLESIADQLGAAIGASRAAVDAGYAPNDMQVGQTGKIVAPDLYIAVGISGAIQHLAGMKDSKVIVAINKDPDAPIFQVADYGLVADLFEALPELQKAL